MDERTTFCSTGGEQDPLSTGICKAVNSAARRDTSSATSHPTSAQHYLVLHGRLLSTPCHRCYSLRCLVLPITISRTQVPHWAFLISHQNLSTSHLRCKRTTTGCIPSLGSSQVEFLEQYFLKKNKTLWTSFTRNSLSTSIFLIYLSPKLRIQGKQLSLSWQASW